MATTDATSYLGVEGALPSTGERMSDFEALMWNIEKDPWLDPSGAMLTITDRPIDVAQLRRRLAHACVSFPRLRERVVPGFGRLSPPVWSTDPEFDIDAHLLHIALPEPGTREQLVDLAVRLYEMPFDRTRPLWRFVVIDGLADGKGAIYWKAHHSISDGLGMVKLSLRYMEQKRRQKLPPKVDLDAFIAAEVAQNQPKEEGADLADSLLDTTSKSLGHVARRQLGLVRRAAGEVAMWGADPIRAKDTGEDAVATVAAIVDQISGGGDADDDTEGPGGSPLWKNRSRHRRLESLRVPLDDAKTAAKALGGTVNDFFVTGAVMGALAYHAERDTPVDNLNISFVVSTRTNSGEGGNKFTPMRLKAPGHAMSPGDRFNDLRKRMLMKREEATQGGGMTALAGAANLLPTSVMTRLARSQSATMDFATSNLRAAPYEMYISGAKVLESMTMGPVAGTAFNLTTISYNGSLDMGVHIDPAAVESPADLKRCLVEAYQELIELAAA